MNIDDSVGDPGEIDEAAAEIDMAAMAKMVTDLFKSFKAQGLNTNEAVQLTIGMIQAGGSTQGLF